MRREQGTRRVLTPEARRAIGMRVLGAGRRGTAGRAAWEGTEAGAPQHNSGGQAQQEQAQMHDMGARAGMRAGTGTGRGQATDKRSRRVVRAGG